MSHPLDPPVGNARLKTYEILRMREITWSVKGALNVLLQSFSSTSIYGIVLVWPTDLESIHTRRLPRQ